MASATDFSDIHVPVLLERCIELLRPAIDKPGAILVDGTLGLAGHAEQFLERFPLLTVVGIDRDTNALAKAAHRLARFGDRAVFVHAVYDQIAPALADRGIASVDGFLFDLGVSSMQLDEADRGFAYSKDAPLDMRMDQSNGLTAESVLADYSEAELRTIFRDYGEEKLAARYAQFIVAHRAHSRLTRSGELVDLLQRATPAALSRQGHPAKRVFQALRIEVNQELEVLRRAIPEAIDLLHVGGRIVVMSYQSLEDRIVKRELVARSVSTAPAGLPVELPEHKPELSLLVRGAELASEQEIEENPRATPVRLRAAERIRNHA